MAGSGPSERLKVLAIHRYFWPDTPPYAAMLRTIAAHWAEQGHDVEILSSQPSYKSGTDLAAMPARQRLDRLRVRRVRMVPDDGPRGRKLRNMIRFSLFAFAHVLLGHRRDVVMCSTAPQVTLGWLVSLAARLRRARFVYHCMDLHPEIGRLSGEFASPLLFRILLRLDLATCRRAKAVVVLSDDMRDALLERDAALASRIVVINNFDLPGEDAPVEAELPTFEGLTVAFTGNLGRFQALEAMVEGVLGEEPELDRVRLVLMGEGAAKPAIEKLLTDAPPARRARVLLLPHGSVADARAVMRAADLGLVSLAPNVIRYAYPSKTATYLAEGLPVLAGVEEDSALARDVRGWGVGDLVGRSPEEARAALLEWLVRRDELPGMRQAATQAWVASFAVEPKLEQWNKLLAGMLEEQS
jgi:glycosyltransferase involved in cell wall biosynthesis